MIRSMYSAISGLRNHQSMMDVVGNNIANVNSTGFKSSSVVFQDVLSQTIFGAGAPAGGLGGTNPAQVGLGARMAGITTNFGQGSLQRTGRSTDFAVQGDGFFVVQGAAGETYTRAGSFTLDADGTVVTPNGGRVRGWTADAGGNVDPNGPVGDLVVPMGSMLAPSPTVSAEVGGNLSAGAAVGTEVVTAVDVFDGQGNPHRLTLTFTKTAADQWGVAADPPALGTALPATLTFDPATGELTAPANFELTLTGATQPGMNDVTIDLGGPGQPGRLTQFGSASTVEFLDQDGYAAGELTGFDMSPQGQLVGRYSNGVTRTIGQLALANFANPEGLEKVGDSEYQATANSGLVQIGLPGTAGRGLLVGGTVEMSNVDLAQEFTNLVVAQRGFQANSRVVTTSDELLQEVVNLKR